MKNFKFISLLIFVFQFFPTTASAADPTACFAFFRYADKINNFHSKSVVLNNLTNQYIANLKASNHQPNAYELANRKFIVQGAMATGIEIGLITTTSQLFINNLKSDSEQALKIYPAIVTLFSMFYESNNLFDSSLEAIRDGLNNNSEKSDLLKISSILKAIKSDIEMCK